MSNGRLSSNSSTMHSAVERMSRVSNTLDSDRESELGSHHRPQFASTNLTNTSDGSMIGDIVNDFGVNSSNPTQPQHMGMQELMTNGTNTIHFYGDSHGTPHLGTPYMAQPGSAGFFYPQGYQYGPPSQHMGLPAQGFEMVQLPHTSTHYPLAQNPSQSSSIHKFGESLFNICGGGSNECCYGFWCPLCMAAKLKADLDGRPCDVTDCLCGRWPLDQLAVRRQVRQKYGLNLTIGTRKAFSNLAACNMQDSYLEDCWLPFTCQLLFLIPCLIPWEIISKLSPLALLCLDCSCCVSLFAAQAYLCTTYREVLVRNPYKTTSYGAHGIHPVNQGPYQSSGIQWDANSCCYVLLCPCCAQGEATAMLQGRDCDACDALCHVSTYHIRKGVVMKYGMLDQSNECGDCLMSCFCPMCMLCQDYQELKLRNSQAGYLSEGWVPPSQSSPEGVAV